MSGKVRKINYGRRFLISQADKSYGEGDYLSALRFTHREIELFGADADALARLADSYENMGLYTSALNCWFRYADCCDPDDLPDAYEGLAVNYLNLGNEAQSAYYYERLVDTDATLTGEDKLQIAEAFASDRRNGFRFVYPPALADFREELAKSGAALRAGDPEGAIGLLSEIPKGCGEYSAAQELLAVAMLLKGDAEGAEETCLALLKENANDVQALATLSALYSEEDRKSESREIADRLCSLQGTTAEEKYKIATVACENGMHDKALELFSQLEKEFPYDGNLLYFKAAAAGESGNYALAEAALGKLTDLYPEAEVAKYYLGALRLHKIYPGEYECPSFTYFYRVPESEKTARTAELKTFLSKKSAQSAAEAERLLSSGILAWTFDEMDGTERSLQALAAECTVIGRGKGSEKCEEFLRGMLLDCEVDAAVKLRAFRLLFAANREDRFGAVFCNIYKEVRIPRVSFGRKKHKLFLSAYAEVSSKFGVIGDRYQRRIARAAESVYRALQKADKLEEASSENALSAAIYLRSDLREAGGDINDVCAFFGAEKSDTENILNAAAPDYPERSALRRPVLAGSRSGRKKADKNPDNA